jgi:hypothetical protein
VVAKDLIKYMSDVIPTLSSSCINMTQETTLLLSNASNYSVLEVFANVVLRPIVEAFDILRAHVLQGMI